MREGLIRMVKQIISGGQTGVDRAALDFSIQVGIACGGWVPKGRIAEDGIIPAKYPNLKEAEAENPKLRTELNVRDADGTLLITRGTPTGGSGFTVEVATCLGKPFLHIDLAEESVEHGARRLLQWLQDFHPQILNVAGPRSSEDHDIYELTTRLLHKVWVTGTH